MSGGEGFGNRVGVPVDSAVDAGRTAPRSPIPGGPVTTATTPGCWSSASLVLMMTTPALALFYGGMSRSKSVLNMMMMSFSALGVVGIVYVLWGWSMTYSSVGWAAADAENPGWEFAQALRQPVRPVRPHGHPARQLRLRGVPADLRGDHRGADQRRDRRPREVLVLAGVPAALGDAVLLPAGPHGVGRRLPQRRRGRPRRPDLRRHRRRRRRSRRSTTPAARSCTSTPVSRAWCSPCSSASASASARSRCGRTT